MQGHEHMHSDGTAGHSDKPNDDEGQLRRVGDLMERFGCTFESAYRTAQRHRDNMGACEEEMETKMRPCLVAIEVRHRQRAYLKDLVSKSVTVDSFQLPFFRPEMLHEHPKLFPTLTWEEVMRLINKNGGIRVFFIDVDQYPACGQEAYERFYQDSIIAEGFLDILAFVTSTDGLAPLVDFLHHRHFGQSRGPVCSSGSGVTSLSSSPSENTAHDLQAKTRRTRILLGNDTRTSVTQRQNKEGMQLTLKEHGLQYIKGVSGRSADVVKELRREADIQFPVIVKPISGAGSEFVTLCYNDEDIDVAFGVSVGVKTTQNTEASYMMLQEYIQGHEYVVNVVTYQGVHVVSDVWRSWKYPYSVHSSRLRPSLEHKLTIAYNALGEGRQPLAVDTTVLLYDRVEFVHDLAQLPEESEERRVVAYTLKCLDALGMRQGCSHCELRVDCRSDSPNFNTPVLIELNARMLGDVPRATKFVGYDQHTLIVYLVMCAAAISEETSFEHAKSLGFASELSQETGAGDGAEEARSLLPWPPAPLLYRSLSADVTRHVLFLSAEQESHLCPPGFKAVQSLRTFNSFTRGSLLERMKTGETLTVSKTFDLLSSPGAIVLEGTSEEILQDTEYIRRVENNISSEWMSLLERAITALCSIRLPLSSHTIELADISTAHQQEWFHELGEDVVTAITEYQAARQDFIDYFTQSEPPLFIPLAFDKFFAALGVREVIYSWQ
ncbi:hypothetical protein TRVL_03605 [Trypanosoma vivax]|nr:hypothetical protein TRVL_03605 [Trypanosoma vivax]